MIILLGLNKPFLSSNTPYHQRSPKQTASIAGTWNFLSGVAQCCSNHLSSRVSFSKNPTSLHTAQTLWLRREALDRNDKGALIREVFHCWFLIPRGEPLEILGWVVQVCCQNLETLNPLNQKMFYPVFIHYVKINPKFFLSLFPSQNDCGADQWKHSIPERSHPHVNINKKKKKKPMPVTGDTSLALKIY